MDRFIIRRAFGPFQAGHVHVAGDFTADALVAAGLIEPVKAPETEAESTPTEKTNP